MTPQEQELVNELFDRLAELESNPRHPDAERLIADGLRRAPHAVYALVQTALVQDEALKRANARIEELQAQVGGEEQQRSGGFLDSMRDVGLGRSEPRGSVPSVHSQAQSSPTTAPPYRQQPEYPPQTPPYPTGCNGHGGPGLWFGRIVSRHGRIDGSGRDWRRAAAQQHPFDVRRSCRPWWTRAERVREFEQHRQR